jgi:hypothetical protein
MKYLLLLLLLVPANVGCAALPYDGSVLREVVDQNPQGAACRCEAVCQ